jgi:hypothetical protein
MKVAVSIPDDVFAEGEALAEQLSLSRSGLYAMALMAFASERKAKNLTEAINEALDLIGPEELEAELELVRRASRQVAARTEW